MKSNTHFSIIVKRLKRVELSENLFSDSLRPFFPLISSYGIMIVFQHQPDTCFLIEIPALRIFFSQKNIEFVADEHASEIFTTFFEVHRFKSHPVDIHQGKMVLSVYLCDKYIPRRLVFMAITFFV